MSEDYGSSLLEYFGIRRRVSKIWIEPKYRAMIIKTAIDKAGSINQVGRIMGYRSKIHPGWSVRQILIGYQPFTVDRLQRLLDFLNIPYEEIEKHVIDNRLISQSATYIALKEYGFSSYILR
ncbi:MAG: hypothetical protein M1481_06850 [Candidatus Thermoplasmatota archaeon]|nr:hypothetical protein [Candidatus Thermoplasmatota archaeon]MCL5964097.1 hypothetical protein [Candidatus Thermoplasmatota archaeon]